MANKFQEAIDAVMAVCVDPSKGLTDASLEIAKNQNDSSFFEDWFGMSGAQFAIAAGMVFASIGVAAYRMKTKRKI